MSRVITIDPGISKCGVIIADIKEKKVYEAVVIKSHLLLKYVKKKYEKDINFVFLNVDNPKWEKYIKNFNVNGIPQINIFDKYSNLELTFIGKQEEETIKESLDNLYDKFIGNSQILNSEFSIIKDNKNYRSSPRSHG